MSHLVESAISKDTKIRNLERKVELLTKEIQRLKTRVTTLEKKREACVQSGEPGQKSDDQDCAIC